MTTTYHIGLSYVELVVTGGNITFDRKIWYKLKKVTNIPKAAQYVNCRSNNLDTDVTEVKSTFLQWVELDS